MIDNPTFFRARAIAEQANADAAELENVRERCQRSADTWSKMAERAEYTREGRAAQPSPVVEAIEPVEG